MSITALNAAWTTKTPDPQSKLVLLKLADCANSQGKAWPSIGTICRDTGLSESTVFRKLNELSNAGLIVRSRQTNSVIYDLNPCHSDTPCHADTLSRCESTPVTLTVTKKRTTKNHQVGKKAIGTIEEFEAYAVTLGLPKTDGQFLFHHFEENGWKRGKEPIKNWRAAMSKWKTGRWLPSLKIESAKKPLSTHDLIANQ